MLKSRAAGLASGAAGRAGGAAEGVCYPLPYLLVFSVEYALLFATLALFFLPAITIVATGRLDWYGVAPPYRLNT
ncbi:MAG: hypothetical protein ABJC66_04805 [Gammaproteobacteria bacterium]